LSSPGLGCFFLFPWFIPVVFCSPGFVSGGVVCPPSCWGYGVWLFVCFVVVFLLFLTNPFRLKSFSRLVFFRLASLRSMVLRRRSFDTATQTLFAVSLCSCCLFHRRRCTSTLGAWFARVVVWFAREGHVCLSGRRNGVFGMDC
jgi:hypothetical protein